MTEEKLTPKGKVAKLNDGGEKEVRHPYVFETEDGRIIGAGTSRLKTLPRYTRYDLEEAIDKDMGRKPQSGLSKEVRRYAANVANVLTPATRLAVTALDPITHSRKYERQRFLEKKAAEQHYDNSKTDVTVGIDPELLSASIEKEELEDFLFRIDPKLYDKVRKDGRESLTKKEYEEEKSKLFDQLSEDADLRVSFLDWFDIQTGAKRAKGVGNRMGSFFGSDTPHRAEATSLPSFGPVECEFFGPDSEKQSIFERNQINDAQSRGFDPTVRGAARKGVVLENSIDNNKILIRNICKPAESLNCTIRIPRVGKDGKKLHMRDRSGNLIEGNFDVVVIRKGKPAMVINGGKGESRIANMADMLGQVDKPLSEMKGATSRSATSDMSAAAGRGAASGMSAAAKSASHASGMRGAAGEVKAPTGVFSKSGMRGSGSTVAPVTTPRSGMKGKSTGAKSK